MATPVSLSLGTRNHILVLGSLKNALQGGILKLFSGAVPASANAAESGVLLMTVTDAGNAGTKETISSGIIVVYGVASGQITQITVNGVNILGSPVVFNATFNQTATDIAAEINNFLQTPEYWASASGTTVTIYAMPGTGASPNSYIVSAIPLAMSYSGFAFSGGIASVNGINFSFAAAAVLSKISGQLLQGNVVQSGTASYWRIYTEQGDIGLVDSVGRYRRAQGLVAASGETCTIPNPALVVGTGERVNSFQIFD